MALVRAVLLMVVTWLVSASPAQAHVECRLDVACPTKGLCTADGDTCVIGGPEDCLSAPRCQSDGECAFDAASRQCRPFAKVRGPADPKPQPTSRAVAEPLRIPGHGCRQTPACRAHGLCQLPGPYLFAEACETGGKADCKASFDCTIFGHCGMALSGVCTPWEDANSPHTCGRGRACKLYGYCSALPYSPHGENGLCMQTSQHAEKSYFCKRSGRCSNSLNDGACARSEICRRFGRCAAPVGDFKTRNVGHGAACVATDCAESEICRQSGACHLEDGRCVMPPDLTPPCELEEIRPLTATASSAQKPWTTYTFGPENLVDRDIQTSWQPEKKKGEGAFFEVVLPREVVLAELHIANGFQRRDGLGDLLRMNGVAGHVQVEVGAEKWGFEMAFDRGDVGNAYPYNAQVNELWGWSLLKLPRPQASRFRVTALSVTPGLVWDDLAISEVRVFACRESQP